MQIFSKYPENMLHNIQLYLYCVDSWRIFTVLKTTTKTYNYENN